MIVPHTGDRKLFDDFHTTRTQAPPSRVTMLVPDIPMVANLLANAFTAMMMGMAGMVQLQIPGGFVHPPPALQGGEEDSSDTRITYLRIDTFLHQITIEHPKQNLEGLVEKFMAQDFYCINELQDKDNTFFQAEPYSLSQGNAKFIVRTLKDAVQQAREAVK